MKGRYENKIILDNLKKIIGKELTHEDIMESFGVEDESELIIDDCTYKEYELFACAIYDFDDLIFYFKVDDDYILLDVMQSNKYI